MYVNQVADIQGFANQQFVTGAAAADHGVIDSDEDGVYEVWASADTWIKLGSTVTDVTATNGYLITTAKQRVLIKKGVKLGSISGGAGTINAHRVG
jgi:hypothetical protein